MWLGHVYLVFAAIVAAQNDTREPETRPENWDPDQCDCYLTGGEYYTGHSFWDFTDWSKCAGTPDIIDDEEKAAEAGFTCKFFKKKRWKKFWTIQSWNNHEDGSLDYGARFPMVNSASNMYFQNNDDDDDDDDSTFLTMRTSRLDSFQTAAQINSVDRFQYLSIRFLGRVHGSSGGCMAMFTYRHAKEIANVQEADMEILTRDANHRVHYTNHPSYSIDGEQFPDATRNESLPRGIVWEDWVEHRMDWTPTRSVWYANDMEVANISFQVPRDPSYMIFNTWSDGGFWTQNMTTGGEAFMDIQWIQMVYNVSDTKEKKKRDEADSSPLAQRIAQGRRMFSHHSKRKTPENVCKMVCSIDGDNKGNDDGEPGEVTWLWGNSTAPRILIAGDPGGGTKFLVLWVFGVVTAVWFL